MLRLKRLLLPIQDWDQKLINIFHCSTWKSTPSSISLFNFLLFRFMNVYVGTPSIEEDFETSPIQPQQCRFRGIPPPPHHLPLPFFDPQDITYAAPLYVDVRYMMQPNKPVLQRNGVVIGRVPIMLRSAACCLSNKTPEQLAKMGECPLDPGKWMPLNSGFCPSFVHIICRRLFYHKGSGKGDIDARTTV